VRRKTKLFLIAGCACILALDAPLALAALAAGWHGPYPQAVATVRVAASALPESPEIARR
jgi:hypothetical protein